MCELWVALCLVLVGECADGCIYCSFMHRSKAYAHACMPLCCVVHIIPIVRPGFRIMYCAFWGKEGGGKGWWAAVGFGVLN